MWARPMALKQQQKKKERARKNGFKRNIQQQQHPAANFNAQVLIVQKEEDLYGKILSFTSERPDKEICILSATGFVNFVNPCSDGILQVKLVVASFDNQQGILTKETDAAITSRTISNS